MTPSPTISSDKLIELVKFRWLKTLLTAVVFGFAGMVAVVISDGENGFWPSAVIAGVGIFAAMLVFSAAFSVHRVRYNATYIEYLGLPGGQRFFWADFRGEGASRNARTLKFTGGTLQFFSWCCDSDELDELFSFAADTTDVAKNKKSAAPFERETAD